MSRVKWVCGLVVAAGMYVVSRTVRRRVKESPRLSRSERKAARRAAETNRRR